MQRSQDEQVRLLDELGAALQDEQGQLPIRTISAPRKWAPERRRSGTEVYEKGDKIVPLAIGKAFMKMHVERIH